MKCGCYVSFVLFFSSFHFIIDKFRIYSLPCTLDCLSEDPSFGNLKTTFPKVFRASLLLAVLWQKCSYLRWAWREHFSHASRWTNTFCTRWVCQTFSFGHSLGGLFCSNFSSYHLIWSSFVRVLGVFPDSIDKRLLYYKQAVFLLRVLSVRVLFMCFRARFKGFGLTYLLSAHQQWLSFQMSLSGFLPPN